MRAVLDIRTISDHFPGIGRYAYHLAQHLVRRRGPEQLLLISNPRSLNTRFKVSELSEGENARILYTEARPFTIREQLCLPGELRKLSPQVTHFPYLVLPYAAPRPLILTVHDIIPVRFPQYFTACQRIRYRICLLLAVRSAAWVICASEATQSDLKAAFRIDSNRISVIQEGVAESFRPPAKNEWMRAKTSYGLPEQYLLFLGSNKPHKNLPALIDAYARLSKAPSLVVAGMEDPRYPEARRRADLLNLGSRVRFIGSVRETDLPALYGGAQAFVFPSIYEGFGLPPLEAMACGTPVACSNIPSLCEAVGDAALLFDPKDPASIALALERVSEDEAMRSELQSRGYRRAAEASWNQAAQKTIDLYRRVANY
jgi:glycosyltransferase involved in cell wall biosynthesis